MNKFALFVFALVPSFVFANPLSNPPNDKLTCSTIAKLKRERDAALAKQDFDSYCKALDGLVRAMPPSETRPEQLKCEAGDMPVTAWSKVRKDVLASTNATYQQQCKRR